MYYLFVNNICLFRGSQEECIMAEKAVIAYHRMLDVRGFNLSFGPKVYPEMEVHSIMQFVLDDMSCTWDGRRRLLELAFCDIYNSLMKV